MDVTEISDKLSERIEREIKKYNGQVSFHLQVTIIIISLPNNRIFSEISYLGFFQYWTNC